jgi:DNA-binding MarR family transcriptional regulator
VTPSAAASSAVSSGRPAARGEAGGGGGRAAQVPAPLADPPAFRFLNEIGIIGQLSRNRFERVLPGGLTVAQFSVLNHFVRLGGERSLVELARAFQVSKPAMGKLVHKLAYQALLRVRDNPDDSRGKLVSITAAGNALRHQAVAVLAPEIARLEAELGDPLFEHLLPGLVRIREWLDRNR